MCVCVWGEVCVCEGQVCVCEKEVSEGQVCVRKVSV